MVYYRKYRSQKIDELDSTHVRDTLFSILSEEPAHAFLFTGPKGLGKTSAARIVAKAVNCIKRSKIKDQRSKPQLKAQNYKKLVKTEVVDRVEPCNECDQCVSITNGTNMDVMEIDAASNRGIDEIRDLREKIWLAPLAADKKVYIIDEVHMLTTEAFNALLKTIEEPPEHAMFVLCTTEPQKVPATIFSRCFHVQFNLATVDEIVRSLTRIVSGEKLLVNIEVLQLIAQRAEGGFRDAAKILEELSLRSHKKKITQASFEELYKTSTIILRVANFLTALKAGDTKSGLQLVGDLVKEGIDLRFFIAEALVDLHKKLLIKLGVTAGSESQFEVSEIKILSELFSKAYSDMKYAVLPQLPLELAVVEFTTNGVDEAGKQSKADEVTVEKLRKEVDRKFKIKALDHQESRIKNPANSAGRQESRVKSSVGPIELMQVPANGEVTKEWMDALWKGLISEMKQYNHTIAGILRSCRIASYDNLPPRQAGLPAGRQGRLLVIGAGYKFHKERLEDKKARQSLKDVCKLLTGRDVEIEVELIKG